MKRIFVFALLVCSVLRAAETAPLVLSFDGKGIALGWDVGVARALHSRLRREAVSDLIFVGTSSGSILATFFACHGFDDNGMALVLEAARRFPKDVLDETISKKGLQLFLGIPPETTYDAVNPILDFVTNYSTCLPTVPVLYAAANLDVIDARVTVPFAGRRDRSFDRGHYTVLENGKVRGKACTYFVNEAMLAIVSRIPAEERLCDLRILRNGAEVRQAIHASISEPTYYPPVPEPDASLVTSLYPVPHDRKYIGGFVLNTAVQDVKRALPGAWVFATGRPFGSRLQNRILYSWFTVPVNETLLDQHWWVDMQIPIPKVTWNRLLEKKTTPLMQAEWGSQATLACLQSDACTPSLAREPLFSKDTDGRLLVKLRGRGLRAILKE